MSKTAAVCWGAVILAVTIAVGAGSHQDWQLRRTNEDTIHFTIRRFVVGHGRWSWTSDVPLSRFHGLNMEAVERGGKAQFEYVQDAGKLVCTGKFGWGSGAGSFDFVPNPQFVGELKKLGYEAPREDMVFPMMMSGLSLDYARQVAEAGVHASIQELADMKSQGVTLDFVRDASLEGYRHFSARDYMDLRNNGVNIGFLRALKDSGYELPVGEITDLRNNGVDAEFLRQLKSYGQHPPAAEIINLRNNGVSPRFLDAVKEAGYDTLSPEDVVSLKNNGVDTDFMLQVHELGYHFTVSELIELHNNGVDSKYLRKLRESGMRTLSASEITKLRQNGVD